MQTSLNERLRSILLGVALCSLAAILAVSTVPVPSAWATSSVEKQAEADALMQKLDAIQTEINAATAEYEQAVSDYEAATAAMEVEQDRIDETDERIDELQVRLGDRAERMYKTGQLSFLDVLLDAASFDQFLTAWDLVERITSSDAALIQESKDLRQEASDARASFEAQQRNADAARESAGRHKDQVEATRSSMLVEIENITAEIAELQAQEELQAEEARRAKEAAERAAAKRAEGAGANAPSGGSGANASVVGNGRFGHPLPGASITSGYGYRDFDASFHQGVDFGAASGTTYYAAESGTVTIADSAGGTGAGKWILINHGDGLATRYLHSSELFVSVGQHVERGQAIGAVGSTGNSSGPHLHFGVTVNGSYDNPLAYL